VDVFDPDLGVGEALSLVAGRVSDVLNDWYEQPKRFRVSFIGIDGSLLGIVESDQGQG
jgi:hypothetical protein